ncbi:hypothetical protein OQX63_05790 [Pedobacter sp. PF22-3]|uniref:hypothetical protein n=1 Tax=Pedobacter sp. PF22-3 TaxID=2994467 RepID=UPI002247AE0A|nr:hypothetical protein [Pedobacter sp. PF22-3]MCX2492974.1 hypothetical protein [Pedobacter sp. PF22-3]
MKRFIGYFDLLGYKEFILNNETEYVKSRLGNVLAVIESCLGRGEYEEAPQGFVADMKKSTIQCLNISDTIIFWTKDNSETSLAEFLEVCYTFNWKMNTFEYPMRGAMVYQEIEIINGANNTDAGGMYNVNTIYGKGLINAHLKCEGQMWAGTVIDKSLEDFILKSPSGSAILEPIAIRYIVPYKTVPVGQTEEYALRLVSSSMEDTAFKNLQADLIDIFNRDNKSMGGTAPLKLDNTLLFAELFKA